MGEGAPAEARTEERRKGLVWLAGVASGLLFALIVFLLVTHPKTPDPLTQDARTSDRHRRHAASPDEPDAGTPYEPTTGEGEGEGETLVLDPKDAVALEKLPTFALGELRAGIGVTLLKPWYFGEPAAYQLEMGEPGGPLWARDGKRFAVHMRGDGVGDRLLIIDLGEGSWKQVWPHPGVFPSGRRYGRRLSMYEPHFAWGRTSSEYVVALASGGERRRLNLWQADGRCLTCPPVVPEGDEGHPSWSSDGRRLAFVVVPETYRYEPYRMAFLDIGALEEGMHGLPLAGKARLTVSPDGSWLAMSRDGLGLIELQKGMSKLEEDDPRHRSLTDHRLVGPASWSPDGKLLAYLRSPRPGGRGAGEELWVAPASGEGEPRRIADDVIAPTQGGPVWTPDGRRLVFVRREGLDRDPIYWADVGEPGKQGVIRTPLDTDRNRDVQLHSGPKGLRMLWVSRDQGRYEQPRNLIRIKTIRLP